MIRCSRVSSWTLALLASFLPGDLAAQSASDPAAASLTTLVPHAEAPGVAAVRTNGSIEIDGSPDEAAWAAAQPITSFTQVDPFEGQPGSERTEVRLLYDEEALYVGAILRDSQPVSTRLARRDAGLSDSDFLVVLVDSYHDHQTAYRFAVNPSGVKQDGVVLTQTGGGGGFGGGGDDSWDPVWDVATRVTEDGWRVEMRIPFSQLRFGTGSVQTWGIQVERHINRNQEDAVFSFTPKLERGGVARFGHLSGIQAIDGGRKLELLPYVGMRAEYVRQDPSSQVAFSNPFRSGSDYFGRAGLDLKYGLGSNLTLNAAANPDFGQVEVDPAVINLTAFETRFEERRPFFVEGADIFRFSRGGNCCATGNPPQVLYSRRIGRAPQGSVSGSAVFSDVPNSTTILGAAKVTGRLGEGWTVGFLEALTGRETAPFVNATNVQDEGVVEPMTNYFVGRMRRDYRSGQTQVGLIATAVNRDLNDPVLTDRLSSAAYVAGADLIHEWSNRMYRINASLSASYLQGNEAAMIRAQRSSTRYFQRPDATHLEVDSAATSLFGTYAMVDVLKQAGSVTAKVAFVSEGRGYEVNDMGFQTKGDRLIIDTDLAYDRTRPGPIFRNWRAWGSPDFAWNSAGDRVFTNVNVNFRWTWLNYWGGSVRYQYDLEALDDRLTRGGPMAELPALHSGNANVNSDSRKPLVFRGAYRWRAGADGSYQHVGSLDFTFRSGEKLQLGLGPSLERSYSRAQYVTSVGDPLATATYRRRYIFAPIDQTTFSLETRLNLTLSPTLTFELYVQPLVSSGRYAGLREFRTPRTFDFVRYGVDAGTMARQADGTYLIDPDGTGAAPSFSVADRDFNVRSLLGNAVLRWEWSPGSTLFLVWQQSRAQRLEASDYDAAGATGIGDFDLSGDSADLFRIRPDNIFQVKVNYWLNL
ncbi:MAG: hypothetical protein EXR91_11450 [Gemmatimonadetes bacterium]|nr:hypothetical protein [Gemmatimonadota bacterium]